MRISQAFPSKYITAGDLQDRAHVLTVSRVEMADIGKENQQEHKPVVFFQGKEKGMVLNKTNAETLAYVYTDETDNWIGKPVEVYPDTVMFQGKVVPCIRVRKPVQAAPAASSQMHRDHQAPLDQVPLSSPHDLDDDIPF
jgi:hypothetical protein